jgi:hypothetical protein
MDMKGFNMKSHWKAAAGATGLAALLFTVGCGARDAGNGAAQQLRRTRPALRSW